MNEYHIKISNLLACLWLLSVLVWSPVEAEEKAPESVEGAVTISAEQAKAMFDEGVVFVDVRNPRLYARKHIPGAHHLDLKSAFDKASLEAIIDYEEPVVIYCSGAKCSRSSRAAAFAVSWGFKKVHYFRGGIVDWKNASYPVETSDL